MTRSVATNSGTAATRNSGLLSFPFPCFLVHVTRKTPLCNTLAPFLNRKIATTTLAPNEHSVDRIVLGLSDRERICNGASAPAPSSQASNELTVVLDVHPSPHVRAAVRRPSRQPSLRSLIRLALVGICASKTASASASSSVPREKGRTILDCDQLGTSEVVRKGFALGGGPVASAGTPGV